MNTVRHAGRIAAAAIATTMTAALSLTPAKAATAPETSICLMLEAAATSRRLPVEFLTRVIWRESNFNAAAVGPRTRSGERAQGIAQFMPGTAAERALADPFDPVQALPEAAAFLRELRDQFGNLGLAAAAYNAGPNRVRRWLDHAATLPLETQRYVRAVTGHDAEEWAQPGAVELATPDKTCAQTVATLDRGGSFAIALHERVRTALARAWGVELAAGFSRERVLSVYARAMTRLSGVIGAHDPVITAGIMRSRGQAMFYRAQIGADTRKGAVDLCGRIRSAGTACVVMRMASNR